MNERIKQLAEQAGSTHKQNLGVYQFYANELEEFVKLIVKECGEVAHCNSHVSGVELGNLMKEYFGVEK